MVFSLEQLLIKFFKVEMLEFFGTIAVEYVLNFVLVFFDVFLINYFSKQFILFFGSHSHPHFKDRSRLFFQDFFQIHVQDLVFIVFGSKVEDLKQVVLVEHDWRVLQLLGEEGL